MTTPTAARAASSASVAQPSRVASTPFGGRRRRERRRPAPRAAVTFHPAESQVMAMPPSYFVAHPGSDTPARLIVPEDPAGAVFARLPDSNESAPHRQARTILAHAAGVARLRVTVTQDMAAAFHSEHLAPVVCEAVLPHSLVVDWLQAYQQVAS